MEYLDNSTVIFNGRSTSTPIRSNERSFTFINPSSSSLSEKKKESPVLHPEIEFAPIPIFGRRRLLELSQAVRDGAILVYNNDNEIEVIHSTTLETSKDNTATITATTTAATTNTATITATTTATNAISLSTKITRQKPNNDYESSKSKSQTQSTVSMSPKLLTAIGSKIRCNRKSGDSTHHKINSKISSKQAKNILNKRIVQHNRETKKVLQSTNKTSIKNQIKSDTNNLFNRNIHSSPKNQKKRENGTDRRTIFKAHPIRKYAPLPVIRKRPLTIPESPKIGLRYKKTTRPR